jgi:hypothetical protein
MDSEVSIERDFLVELSGVNEYTASDDHETNTHDFDKSMRNLNTVRKTNSDVNLLSNWLKTKNENRSILELEVTELDRYLAVFFF